MRNQRVISSTAIGVILVCFMMIQPATQFSCPDKQTFFIETQKPPTCVNCPENCNICYVGLNSEIVCAYCLPGHYSNIDSECKPCAENCEVCTGGKIEQCQKVKLGHFYDYATKTIIPCKPDNCASCHSVDECSLCKEGFYPLTKEKNANGVEIVTCGDCGIENCLYCGKIKDQVEGQEFITCKLCAEHYSLVSGKCQKCPKNCESCADESKECMTCKKGFSFDESNTKCKKITVENCHSAKSDGTCEICDSHYYLEEGTCKLCSEKTEHCSMCHNRDNEFKCLSCLIGFRLNDKGECESCPDNCNHCTAEKCFVCSHTYFYNEDAQECQVCPIKNCVRCERSNFCDDCVDGYYFNKKKNKCLKCKGNCLQCVNDQENCLSCGISQYTLELDQISHKKAPLNKVFDNIFSLFFGVNLDLPDMNITEIKIQNKCVESCPKEYKGKPVIVHEAERKCIVKLSEDEKPASHLPEMHHDNNILNYLNKLKVKYTETIKDIEESSNKKVGKEVTGSLECNYNGVLKKELRGDADSYYICRCVEGYIGDNCQIPIKFYNSIQDKLQGAIDDVKKNIIKHDKHGRKLFLEALLLINKFKINRATIEKIVSVTKAFLEKDKAIDSKKKLYLVYDALILNLFDLMEDIRKRRSEEIMSDVNLQEERDALVKDVEAVLDMIVNSLEDLKFANSFLDSNSKSYMGMETYSYILSEFRYKNYDDSIGYMIANPNIDTSYNITNNDYIFFKFNDDVNLDNSKYNLQVLNFASPLFSEKIRKVSQNVGASFRFVSNTLYIKSIDPENPHMRIKNAMVQLKEVVIKFSMNYIPIFEDLRQHLHCVAYNFKEGHSVIQGRLLEVDDEEEYIICAFELFFETQSYYFTTYAV